MPLAFGLTVLPDPADQRLIEVRTLGVRTGFEYGWTPRGAATGTGKGGPHISRFDIAPAARTSPVGDRSRGL